MWNRRSNTESRDEMEIRWIGGDGMTIRRKRDLMWLTFPDFDSEDWILHAFSTRFGGVSRDHLASMNLSFTPEDDEANVRENFSRFASAVGFDTGEMVFSDQTHTVNVRRVGKEDRGAGFLRPLPWKDVDGLVTDEPDVMLVTFYADCVPLYFIDPEHHAVGLSHSGWRGTAEGMARVTIEKMREEFGTDPRKMKAAIGPSVCGSCYEVSGDVAEKFPSYFVRAKKNGKYLLDLQGVNRAMMISSGIPMSSISMPGLCTMCNPDLLFSHRASGGKRGTNAGFLKIRCA